MFYKLVADNRAGSFFVHKIARTVGGARRGAQKLLTQYPDVVVVKIDRQRSTDVTNKILDRPGPCFRLDSVKAMRRGRRPRSSRIER